jgi:hypothetical protein
LISFGDEFDRICEGWFSKILAHIEKLQNDRPGLKDAVWTDEDENWRAVHVKTAVRVRCELLHFAHRGAHMDVAGFTVDFFQAVFIKIASNPRVEYLKTENQFAFLAHISNCAVNHDPDATRLAKVRRRLQRLHDRKPEILAFSLNEPGHFVTVFMRLNSDGQVEVVILDSIWDGRIKRWRNIKVNDDHELAC